jgi:hypothetical protein
VQEGDHLLAHPTGALDDCLDIARARVQLLVPPRHRRQRRLVDQSNVEEAILELVAVVAVDALVVPAARPHDARRRPGGRRRVVVHAATRIQHEFERVVAQQRADVARGVRQLGAGHGVRQVIDG